MKVRRSLALALALSVMTPLAGEAQLPGSSRLPSGLALEFIALLSAALFAGWALYISLIEHPVILETGVNGAVEHFRKMYRRAAPWQASMAALALLSAVMLTYSTRDWAWAGGGIVIGLVIPFTLLVIMPTNRRLLATPAPQDDVVIVLLKRWGRLHDVRTMLGAIGLVMLLSKVILR